MKKLLTFLLVASLFVLNSCSESQFEEDTAIILDYIATNNLTTEVTPEGVHYIITKEGTGENPSNNATVKVNYVGTLLDGTQFDANNNLEFSLNGVIQGWKYGIPTIKKGGSGTLIIPSTLAYGSRATGLIPSNSVLLFDVDLLDFVE